MNAHPDYRAHGAACLMYGTAWKEDDTERCVRAAFEGGFRLFDTANQRKHYDEELVGAALAECRERHGIARSEIFIQTKFTHLDGQDHRLPYDPAAGVEEQVRQSFESSLRHLRTDYLDSFILHGPTRRSGLGTDDWAAWRAMTSLLDSGRVRAIGLSNVNAEQVRLIAEAGMGLPTFVQNRCYAATGWDREVRAYCASKRIRYQGFSLLTANRGTLADARVVRMARNYQLTPEGLVFAFAVSIGMLPLTGTQSPVHMRDDLAAASCPLDPDDVRIIEMLALG